MSSQSVRTRGLPVWLGQGHVEVDLIDSVCDLVLLDKIPSHSTLFQCGEPEMPKPHHVRQVLDGRDRFGSATLNLLERLNVAAEMRRPGLNGEFKMRPNVSQVQHSPEVKATTAERFLEPTKNSVSH